VDVLDLGFGVGVEVVEQVGELLPVGQVEAVALLAALEEDGTAGVLEDGVDQWIALGDFLGDLGVDVVADVFGFPEASAVENVAEDAIGEDVLFADGQGQRTEGRGQRAVSWAPSCLTLGSV